MATRRGRSGVPTTCAVLMAPELLMDRSFITRLPAGRVAPAARLSAGFVTGRSSLSERQGGVERAESGRSGVSEAGAALLQVENDPLDLHERVRRQAVVRLDDDVDAAGDRSGAVALVLVHGRVRFDAGDGRVDVLVRLAAFELCPLRQA